MPREDLRKIGARDRHAADKIAELRRRHPDALILVLFGESHLAPQHLPALLRQRLPGETMLTVLQNVDALYWRAAGEAHDHVEAVQVRKEVRENIFCVFNATPLEKYENYRLCLDRWGRSDNDHSAPDLGPTLYNLIDGMVRFLGINQYSPHNTTQPRLLVDLMPEVYSRSSDALLRRLLSRKGFTAEQRRSLLRQVRERGQRLSHTDQCRLRAPVPHDFLRRGRYSLPPSSLSRTAESLHMAKLCRRDITRACHADRLDPELEH